MKIDLRILAGITAVATLAAGIHLSTRNEGRTDEKMAAPTASLPGSQGESLRTDWTAEDVFRRAFWRHPQADDKIVEAVRTESSGADGVNRWVWFMKIHPGAALLRDLRDPATFGLISTNRPSPLPEEISRPAWFPAARSGTGMEILQHPTQPLTLLYHAEDNLLYASDHGRGFNKAYAE
jgi:hypothetical protein